VEHRVPLGHRALRHPSHTDRGGTVVTDCTAGSAANTKGRQGTTEEAH
jgi:hypothetical protein